MFIITLRGLLLGFQIWTLNTWWVKHTVFIPINPSYAPMAQWNHVFYFEFISLIKRSSEWWFTSYNIQEHSHKTAFKKFTKKKNKRFLFDRTVNIQQVRRPRRGPCVPTAAFLSLLSSLWSRSVSINFWHCLEPAGPKKKLEKIQSEPQYWWYGER